MRRSSPFSGRLAGSRNASLVVASMDIGRALADCDGIAFRGRGMCMYPVLCPGDRLRIESRPASEVRVGEIAVCRGKGVLFAHRVIATGMQDGRAYIITRPDRTKQGDDGVTFDDNLLGIIVAIVRNGRQMPLDSEGYSRWMRLGLELMRIGLETAYDARSGAGILVGWIQKRAFYRFLGQKLFAFRRLQISFVVRIPFRATTGIYQAVPAGEFQLENGPWQDCTLACWLLALHLNQAKEPAGLATFVRTPEGWELESLEMRPIYRGLGLEDTLLNRAKQWTGVASPEKPEKTMAS